MPTPSVDTNDPVDVVQYLATLDLAGRAKWLSDNHQKLSDDVFRQVQKAAPYLDAGEGGSKTAKFSDSYKARWEKIQQAESSAAPLPPLDMPNLVKAAREAVGSGQVTDGDLNKDGKVSAAEAATLDRTISQAASEASKQTGIPQDQVEGEIERQVKGAEGLVVGDPIPPPGVQKYVGGVELNEQQKFDLIKAYNEANPEAPVTNIAEVYQRLGEGELRPDDELVLADVFLGQEPITSYTVKLPGGGSYMVSADELEMFTKFGDNLDKRQLTRLIRTADRIGLRDATGEAPAWQMLAALARAKRIDTDSMLDAGSPTVVVPQRGPIKDVGEGPQLNEVTTIPTAGEQRQRNRFASDPDFQKGLSSQTRAVQMGQKFKEGKTLYPGSDTMAFIHALDPTLAARVSSAPQSKWTIEDRGKVGQYLVNGGLQQESFMGLNITGFNDWDEVNNNPEEEAGGAGPTRNYPDPVAIKQTAKALYQQLFAQDPTEDQLAQFAAVVDQAISSAPDNASVDGQARLQQAMERTGLYQQLYANKPSGMTEADYRSQFEGGARQMLGQQAADPTAIQAGMRTGNFQTTVGAVAGDEKNWQQNSTFLGRLARAAQLINENT